MSVRAPQDALMDVSCLRDYLWDHLPDLEPYLARVLGLRDDGVSTRWLLGSNHAGRDKFQLTLEKFSGGQSNPTFLVKLFLPTPYQATSLVCRCVLRKKPASVKVLGAHAIEREFQVLHALLHTPVPVPAALLLCTEADVIGTPFYLMEFVEGRVFTDPALPQLQPTERAAVYREVAATLAKIHKVDFRSCGLGSFGKAEGGYFARQLKTLLRVARKQAEDAGPVPGLEEVAQDLQALCTALPDMVTLVHGDYRVDNVMFHLSKARVVAVLDWELSTLGHPLADLASLTLAYQLQAKAQGVTNPTPLTGLRGLDLASLGIPTEDQLVDIYKRDTGFPPPLFEWLGFSKAFVCFKNAVIAHGVASRLARGVASSTHAASVVQMIPIMVQLARDHVLQLKGAGLAPPGVGATPQHPDGSGGGLQPEGGAEAPVHRRQKECSTGITRSSRRWAGVRAVLFDVGGVLSASPIPAIVEFERNCRPPLPAGYISAKIAGAGEHGLFQRLERGEEVLSDDFLRRFEKELLLSPSTRQESPPHSLPAGQIIDVRELFKCIAAQSHVPIPPMIALAKQLKDSGIKVGVVSNDFRVDPECSAALGAGGGKGGEDGPGLDVGRSVYWSLHDCCHVVVRSSQEGCRKPEERIYRLACQRLGIRPEEAVFVDDIRANLKAARALGMRTIWVDPWDSGSMGRAVEELRGLLGEVADVSDKLVSGGSGGGVARKSTATAVGNSRL